MNEKITKENKRLILQLAQEIPKETEKIIQKLREDNSSSRSLRLTIEQRILAKNGFKLWFEKLIEYEFLFNDESYRATPEYELFNYSRFALSSFTKSMFVCMRCGEIVPVNDQLVIQDNIRMHKCNDGDLGHGDRTSWLNLYATFVINPILKRCLLILNEIMENK